MFEVSVQFSFAAAHFLRGYKGKCENLHGHNYRVEITCAGPSLDDAGMLTDFVDLKAAARQIFDRVDHRNLNDTPPFDELNPSAENIAWYFCTETQKILGDTANIAQVKVWETDSCYAVYRP